MLRFTLPSLQLLRNLRSMLPLFLLATSVLVIRATPPPPQSAIFNGSYVGVYSSPLQFEDFPAVAVDASGNVFAISQTLDFDTFQINFAVIKLAPQPNGSYTRTTLAVASQGDNFGGIAVDSSGRVYYTDMGNNVIVKLTLGAGVYRASVLPISVSVPVSIQVDSAGDIYVGSGGSSLIYKEVPMSHGYTQTTVFNQSLGYAGNTFGVDGQGNVYVADPNDRQVIILQNQGDGTYSQTTVPVAGLNSNAYFDWVAVDPAGNIFLEDLNSNRLLEEVNANGGYTQVTLPGSPSDIGAAAVDGNDNVYFAFDNNVIGEFKQNSVNFASQPVSGTVGSSSGTYGLHFTIASGTTVGSVSILTSGASGKDFTDGGSSTCTAQTYDATTSCVVNVNFTPLVPGARNGAVVIADGSGNPLATVPIYGTGTGPQAVFAPTTTSTVGTGLFAPYGIAFDGAGNLYSAVFADHIVKIAPDGTQTNLGSGFGYPNGVAVDGAGNVYVTDSGNGNLYKLTPAGVQTVLATGINNAYAVAVDGAGNLYFQQNNNAYITKLAPDGTTTHIGSGLGLVFGLTVDASGTLYATDYLYGDIFKISPSGTKTTIAAGFSSPTGIAVDSAGNLYIVAYPGGGAIFEYSTSGVLTTLANGTGLYGVALDNAGNIYYSDPYSGNGYISVLPRTAPSFTFATTTEHQVSSTGTEIVTLENIGNANLQFSYLHTPSGFPEVDTENQCFLNHLVHPGGECNFGVEFFPSKQYTGSPSYNWSGNVTLTSNTLNTAGTTLSVPVSGTMTFPTAATPVISPAGGSYGEAQTVTITCSTPGSIIFYTTNGGQPTANSTLYNGQITVSSSKTITAMCEETGYIHSSSASQTYTIN